MGKVRFSGGAQHEKQCQYCKLGRVQNIRLEGVLYRSLLTLANDLEQKPEKPQKNTGLMLNHEQDAHVRQVLNLNKPFRRLSTSRTLSKNIEKYWN